MLHFHPLFSAIIIPFTLLVFFILLPYFSYDSEGNGIWFYSDKGRRLAINAIIISLIFTIAYILIDEYFLQSLTILKFIPDILSNGLFPFLIIIAAILYYSKYLGRKRSANKIEIVQSIFLLLFCSFFIFTLVGIFFRGKGMSLTIF